MIHITGRRCDRGYDINGHEVAGTEFRIIAILAIACKYQEHRLDGPFVFLAEIEGEHSYKYAYRARLALEVLGFDHWTILSDHKGFWRLDMEPSEITVDDLSEHEDFRIASFYRATPKTRVRKRVMKADSNQLTFEKVMLQ